MTGIPTAGALRLMGSLPLRSWAACASLCLLACGSSGGSNGGAAGASSPGGDSNGGDAPAQGGADGGTAGTNVIGSNAGAQQIPTNLVPADVACKPNLTPKVLPIGKWTALGPPGIEKADYGMVGVSFDPSDRNVLYTTVQDDGIWKSCDAGATWFRLGAPNLDPEVFDGTTNYLDVPFEVAVDPKDSKHLYATDGVRGGSDLGFWVSHDGGALWQRGPAYMEAAKQATVDLTDFAVDPSDFNHVLVASHSPWNGKSNAGVMETQDGGTTWILHDPDPSWPVGTNGIEFLYDPASKTDNKTWINLTSDGQWLTTNAGASWKEVGKFGGVHGLDVGYRASNGTLYAGATGAPIRSIDNGMTWTQDMKNLPFGYFYVVSGTEDTLFTAKSLNSGQMPFVSFYSSPVADGVNWTQYGGADEAFSDGPIVMKYDEVNHILYSANWKAGLIALKTK